MTTTTISDRQFEIIEAAGRILSTAGVNGLTIKKLAQEMHFSESAVYRHFASKEAIIVALLAYLADNMEERLSRITAAQDSPQEILRAVFLHQFHFFAQNPHFVVAVFSDGLMEESPKINAAILRIMEVKKKHLIFVVQAGQKDGVFTDKLSTAELVHIIMGAFRLEMFKWRIAQFQSDIEQKGKNTLEALLTLIKP